VAQLGLVRRSGLRLLAEKVETNAEFERCRELGFDYFQGYFFARPEQLSGRRMPASRLSVLRLVAALQAPDATFEQVRDVIAADPPLSFKLLKLVNSAALRGGSEITSLQAAVALLGLDRVRSWASLLALSKLTDKSPALSVTTLVRAHLCEAVGRSALQGAPAEDYFIAGLLSTIDAYFDRTMAEVVKELPVAAPIQRALVRHGGKLGAILRACIDYERGAFEAIRWWELEALGITPQLLEAHYREALRVADIAANLLGEASH
jgi:EAL and modified HD-GYP domain-containing signal transduction protein